MLLRQAGDDVIAIGQASHAWVSGQLARAWGNESFAPPTPREELCLAAEQHDVGWSQWDISPTLDADTGRPYDFLGMPSLAASLALWQDAPDRLLMQSAYAALLVSMHGTALYGSRDPGSLPAGEAQLVHGYLVREEERQRDLMRRLAADPAQVARNQRLLWTLDSLSLALCLPSSDYAAERVRSCDGGEFTLELHAEDPERFVLTPWPFAHDELRLRCEGRLLGERFTSEGELKVALAAAPLQLLEFTLHPG